MRLTLHPSTKKAFTDIDSSDGFTSLNQLYNHFKEHPYPIPMQQFAELLNLSDYKAFELAKTKGELNKNNELVGLLGLSIVPTNHKLIIDNQTFYTWCAADTLIFPALLTVRAQINSHDPLTNSPIEIIVSNDEITSIKPKDAYISWVDTIDENDIKCSMCNRVHFFSSKESANTWHGANKDARIFSVTDYFTTDISLNHCC